MIDAGMEFWLRHVEERGGLWEPAGDSVLVMLPPELGERYGLVQELHVTSDPDVAREDGVTLLSAGHPVLTEAAAAVLAAGDAGLLLIEPPLGARPADPALLDRARSQLPISHGRIDLTGPSRSVTCWLLRVGVLVSYTVSAEDRFQEQIERWVDVGTRREMPATVVERLVTAPVSDKGQWPSQPWDALPAVLAEAHRLVEADARRRRSALSTEVGDASALEQEQARARSYYADVLAGIEQRMAAVTPERRAQLEQRLVGTREEQNRRLAEIAEKHQARHEIRPYRLHLIGVPAARLPVEVRRGERRYPLVLDWLAPARAFTEPRCPSCDAAAPLVAGKAKLGCLTCLTPATRSDPAAPERQADRPKSRPGREAGRPVPPPAPAAPPTPTPASTPSLPIPASKQSPPIPAANQRPPATAADRRSAVSGRQPAPESRAAPKQAEKLAAAVWRAVAERRARKLRDMVATGSPAAALLRLCGVDGPRHVLGTAAHEELVGFSAASSWLTEDSGFTSGLVQTSDGEYPYALHWRLEHRMLTVLEVLTAPPYQDGRLSRMFWWFRREPAVPAATDLTGQDAVTRALVSAGVAWHGLDVAARAVAAWWRLGPPPLDGQPAAVAAALHRLVASRAGDKGLYREAAEVYRVDEAAVRRADPALRKALALGPGRPW